MSNPKKKLSRKQLHHDPLMERVTAVSDFAQVHSKRIGYVIGGIALLAIIIYSYMTYRSNQNAESVNKLVTAEQVFFSGDYKEAIRRLERFIPEWEGTTGGGMGTYYLATAYFNTDQFDFAKQYYESYVNDYSDNELFAASSMAGIAACWEGLNNYDEAIGQYERTIGKFPDFYLTPEYMLSLARCYKMAQKYDEAKKVYERVTKDFPESNYARDARAGMEELS